MLLGCLSLKAFVLVAGVISMICVASYCEGTLFWDKSDFSDR